MFAIALCSPLLVSCLGDARQSSDDSPLPGIWLDPVTRGGVLPSGVEWRSMGPRGLDLTKASEAFRARVYSDPVGFCTVGYGHLIKRVRCDGTEPREFLPSISEAHATRLLAEDLELAEYPVLTEVSRDISFSQAQFDALVDFVFNVGPRNFRESTLLKVINAKEFHLVPQQLRRWVYADGKRLPGLVIRREREAALFMEGVASPRGLAEEDLPPIDIRSGEN
jgi:GH24 family phage-related lysozyme (muramidase)